MNYFIVDNGQQAGPYTIDELVKRGLNSDTLVWAEGMTDWTPAWQVEELKNYLYAQQTPPPPPDVYYGQDMWYPTILQQTVLLPILSTA